MTDPDEWDEEHESRYDDHPYDDDDQDEYVLNCGTKGCLEIGYHCRSECYTIEHVQAYERYHKPRWWHRIEDFIRSVPWRIREIPYRIRGWWNDPGPCHRPLSSDRSHICTLRRGHAGDCDDLPF